MNIKDGGNPENSYVQEQNVSFGSFVIVRAQ